MRKVKSTSRSNQFITYLFLLFLLAGCSYPSIELHQSLSALTSGTNKQQVEEQIDDLPLEKPQDESIIDNSMIETDKSEDHFADKEQIESIDSIQDGEDKSVAEHENENKHEQNINDEEQNKEETIVKRIAITFDDGPDLNYTPKILDILKDKEVIATFYVVGMQVQKYPEVLQRIEEEGHLIGNHSFYHPNFTKLSKKELEKEINDTDEKIFAVLGHVPTTVRPPYGSINDSVREQLTELGKETVLWNIDPRDWDGTTVNDMFDNIKENARDGGNILLHSFGSKHVENTVELLPMIIDELRDQGYQFVTVDELT